MRFIERPSPNFDARSAGLPIDVLLLHYTGMQTAAAALDRLCDPEAKVSCHYAIDEDGTVYRMVEERDRAWHAGVSYWAGDRGINDRSIGIELVNPGHEWGYRPFPEAQMASLIELARDILARHPIPPARVLGHSDVAPTRKQDPGELFDWERLARRGIGRWPDVTAEVPMIEPAAGLAKIGYELAGSDVPPEVVMAFQRRFRPARVDGQLDDETRRRIAQVAAVG